MTIKIAKSMEEFVAIAGEQLFEDLRQTMHDLDDQATSAGMDNPDMLLLLSAKIATALAAYTAYLTAGVYAACGADKQLIDEAISSFKDDLAVAMGTGVAMAARNLKRAKADTKAAEAATADLLKKVVKKWPH